MTKIKHLCGTASAVPFQNLAEREFFRSLFSRAEKGPFSGFFAGFRSD
jgi:hypothetical protein